MFDLNEALAFIADDPAFWIRAKVWWRDIAAAPMRGSMGFNPCGFNGIGFWLRPKPATLGDHVPDVRTLGMNRYGKK